MSRIIPARAGFTCAQGRSGSGKPDHPRSRGVYVTNVLAPALVAGSSPLARGLLEDMDMSENTDRIIPARAGFTGGCDDEAEAV